MIHIKGNFVFIIFLLIFSSIDPSLAEDNDKGEIVRAEIPIEAEIISTFKTEREDMSKPREGKQVNKEMNATVLVRLDEETNTRTFIFE